MASLSSTVVCYGGIDGVGAGGEGAAQGKRYWAPT